MAPKTRSLEERFWAKVDRRDSEDCWLWLGQKTQLGYGRVWLGRKDKRRSARIALAHRVAYRLTLDDELGDTHLHHVCGNRACVNPNHLEPITQLEHNRIHGLHENGARFHRTKTHCLHGHPYDEHNTYYSKHQRSCRTCHREAVRRYSAKKRSSA